MAIPVVETTAVSNQTTNATSKTDVTSPSGVVADDIVLIFIALDGNAGNPEANADGFAQLTSLLQGAIELYVLWKRSTGSEPANYTVNWTGNEQARFMTVRVSGCVTTGNPWDVISGSTVNSGSVDNVINRLTSTVTDSLALYGCAVDRNRVDGADTITGTGWTEVGVSGSSGGANGAGLIVGQNDMPSIEQVEAGTFGTWSSDQNVSKGFNLEGAAGGAALERTASQTLTHTDSVAQLGVYARTATQTNVHTDSVIREGSTFQRTASQTTTHTDSVVRVLGKVRTAAQTLIHTDSVVTLGVYARTAAQTLIHTDSVVKLSELLRTAIQTLIHTDSVSRQLGKARTAAQTLIHTDSVVKLSELLRTFTQVLTHTDTTIREGSTFQRTASQTLTHTDSVARIKGAVRTVTQILTHTDSVVRLIELLRTASQTLIHTDVASRVKGLIRTVTQVLIHTDVAVAVKATPGVPFRRRAVRCFLTK